MRGVRKWLVLSALAIVASLLPRVAVAEELPQNDGFVYMIISAPEPDFTLGNFDDEGPSGTILVRLGMLVSGETVLDARFLAENVPPFALPEGVSLSDLDGNQVTVIGGIQVPDPEGEGTLPHIITPAPPDPEDPIDPLVQQAIFDATHDGRLDGLGPNPTVLDIVESIVGGNELLSMDAVFSAVFSTPMTFDFASGIVSTEGEMFPHQPEGATFHFKGKLEEGDDDDVGLTFDMCTIVGIDVKPGNAANKINFNNDNGVVKVAFLSDEHFDATQVDPDTAVIGGVGAVAFDVRDVNHDGLDDILLTFSVGDLVDGGAADTSTTELKMQAFLTDGSCVEGTDSVQHTNNG